MKEFIQLLPPAWQELYACYTSLKQQSKSKDEIILQLNLILARTFRSDIVTALSQRIYASFESTDLPLRFYDVADDSAASPDSSSPTYVLPEAQLSLFDLSSLREILSRNTSQDMARLLVALLVFARANPHPSNWIKYDRKVIMFLASLSKKKAADQTSLTNALHSSYGINMRVIGSSQPIPCFNVPWIASQPPVNSPDNPLIDIGPLTPQTIAIFVDENHLYIH